MVSRSARCRRHPAEGRRASDGGDYRWAAQILHNLVVADPGNTAARQMQAAAYEPLGHQPERPQWRASMLLPFDPTGIKSPSPYEGELMILDCPQPRPVISAMGCNVGIHAPSFAELL